MMLRTEEAARQITLEAGKSLAYPTRALFAAGADYGQHAGTEVLSLAMIESAEAMKNLDEIVSTPRLDGVYIGPADLTLGLTGRKYPTGFDRQEPEMIETIQMVVKKAKAVGWGFNLVTISNDVRLLAGAAQQSIAQARELIGEAPSNAKEITSNGY